MDLGVGWGTDIQTIALGPTKCYGLWFRMYSESWSWIWEACEKGKDLTNTSLRVKGAVNTTVTRLRSGRATSSTPASSDLTNVHRKVWVQATPRPGVSCLPLLGPSVSRNPGPGGARGQPGEGLLWAGSCPHTSGCFREAVTSAVFPGRMGEGCASSLSHWRKGWKAQGLSGRVTAPEQLSVAGTIPSSVYPP